MTFKEAMEITGPDEKTSQQNIDFLEKEVSPKLEKEIQVKMKSVVDGLKQQQVAQKNLVQQQQKEKNIEQTKKPNGQIESTAQISNTIGNAQVSNTSNTAQPSNTSVLTKRKK